MLNRTELLSLHELALDYYNAADYEALKNVHRLKNPNVNDMRLIIEALLSVKDDVKVVAAKEAELCDSLNSYIELIQDDVDYSHTVYDYEGFHLITDSNTSVCENLCHINKFGHHTFRIYPLPSVNFVKTAWSYREKDALVYVEVSEDGDDITISVRKSQFDNFLTFLRHENISFNEENIASGIRYNNKNSFTMIDTSGLGITPYPFQVEDAKHVLEHKRYLIGHEMGCGKTIIATLACLSIPLPKLVICPETLRLNWEKEIERISNGTQRVAVLYSKDKYDNIVTPDIDWLVVGYSTVSKYKKELARDFRLVIVDEVHNCKAVDNWGRPASKRAGAVLDICDKAEYVYLLSGTPLPARNKDLYNILKILRSDLVDYTNKKSFFQYGIKYCAATQTAFGMDYTGNSNSKELHIGLGKSMVRRLRRDVLPHLKKDRKFIPIKPTLSREYRDIEKRLYAPEQDDTYMSLAMTGRKILSTIKLHDAALDLADSLLDAGEKVVIATLFTETVTEILDYYGDKACAIVGGMSDKKKQAAVESFENGDKTVCVINIIAGGVGITLASSSNLIMLDFDWTPANNAQAEDRICRIGQRAEFARIYYLYAENSIFDKLFIEMISNKAEHIADVVDGTASDFNLAEDRATNSSYLAMLKNSIENSVKYKKAHKVTKKERSVSE